MPSETPSSPELQMRITAVIVLYQRHPEESEAYMTLKAASAAVAQGATQDHAPFALTILLADNTPGAFVPSALPTATEYRVTSRNEGLASAYNWALERAEQNGSQWLLTLDQDTRLPNDFLQALTAIAREVDNTPSIAAIVPQIVADGKPLSPYHFLGGAVPAWIPAGFHGVPPEDIFAFNSGSLLRVSVLRQIDGYNPWFWLDNSDAFLFHRLHRFGKRVFVAGHIRVDHDFSMLDLRNRVSVSRYHNILLAESGFWDGWMSRAAGLERTARLALRLVRQVRRKDPPALRAITFAFLKRRLIWSRKRRLREWKEQTLLLFPELAHSHPNPAPVGIQAERPKVSVCMAAFNGVVFIEQQLRSILQQLGPKDEIVVVDDASTDQTVDVILALNSPAIRLIRHAQNCGVVATFEEALRNATGKILFLADGDDIWAPNKVELFLQSFAQNPDIDLMTSRVSFIDRDGDPMQSDLYRNRKVFKDGFWDNLLRNHFQGSAMAFRASLLQSVLPFPKNVLFLHDHWIGVRNAHAGGRAICLEQSLLFYRRHGNNLSERLPRSQQIRLRVQLLRSYLTKALKDLGLAPRVHE